MCEAMNLPKHFNALMADQDVSTVNLRQTSKLDEMLVVMGSYETTSQCVKRRRASVPSYSLTSVMYWKV